MSKAVGKSKSTPPGATGAAMPAAANGIGTTAVLRRHAEEQFAEELAALAQVDDPAPPAALAALALGRLDLSPRRDARRRVHRSRPSTSATAA